MNEQIVQTEPTAVLVTKEIGNITDNLANKIVPLGWGKIILGGVAVIGGFALTAYAIKAGIEAGKREGERRERENIRWDDRMKESRADFRESSKKFDDHFENFGKNFGRNFGKSESVMDIAKKIREGTGKKENEE